MHSIGTWWMWLGFIAFIVIMVGIDIVFVGRHPEEKVSSKHAAMWLAVWVGCAVIFGIGLAFISKQRALEFFTGYVIEKTLSIDNMFTFLMIFNYFSVPSAYQRRVLLYGVLSAIVMRLLMITVGTWLVSEFHWVLYLFGIFLVFTGIKMLLAREEIRDLAQNPLLNWLRNHLRVTHEFHAEKFFVKQRALWYVTPLFLVLILVEISDLVFALDSLPAIFAITNDIFVIFTSNIFAILGLRSLYFLLANMAERFSHLKYGVAFILVFIGVKMLIEPWQEVPILVTFAVMITALTLSVLKSEKRR